MQKKVLLVYPEIPKKTYWSYFYALSLINKKSISPPLGLLTVAAMLPEHYELKLVDMNVNELKEKDILWADSVFVSAMIVQQHSFSKVIELCNKLERKVIAGGPYVTLCHQDIKGVDCFVLGEIEQGFSTFLKDFDADNLQPIYKNDCWPDLKETVTPRYDLINFKNYSIMSVQYSRGCPYNCEFCDIWKLYGNKPRVKNTQNIIHELDRLYTLGWRGTIFFVDDNFIGNKNSVKLDFLPELIKWQKQLKYPFRFLTQASINIATDEKLLEAMRDAAFNEVFVGIETLSPKSLLEARKYNNMRIDMYKAVQTIHSYGIEVSAGFIFGFDCDTQNSSEQIISFIQQTSIPVAMVGLLIALPGTDLYYRLNSEGRILRESDGDNTHSISTNFITKMDRNVLSASYLQIIKTIYDRNLKNYFKRCNSFLDSIGFSKFVDRKIGFSEILMFVRSLIKQPFTPYGIQYIKFILRNLVKNRRLFGIAVRFSIIGHHFHKITQESINKWRQSSMTD